MPSTYSSNLKLELMATGENSGTWGNITNTNLGTAVEQAIVGYGNPNYASDANLTISITNSNAAQAARALVLNVTSSLSLTGTRELVVPTIEKQYIVQNNTTGSQSITVKTSAGTGITVPNGRKAHLYVDGTNVIQMFDFVDINGGTIDGTAIGGSSAAAGSFTTLGASGAATFNGAVTLGDAAADNITFNGTITSHLLFTDNTYDIGASGATRPRNLFLAGNATVGGNLSVGGTLTLTGGVNLNGNVTVGDSSADTLTINATITSNLLFTDNTYDIGASGATRPRNLFLAGNATIGGNTTLTGSLTVDSTTDSTSATTGSIQTDGGVGIAKALFVGTTVTINGGTANGVAYLNGSKVLTTGSALTFDGTKLSLPTVLAIKGAQNSNIARISMTRTDQSWSINNETDLRFYGQNTDTETPSSIAHSMGNTGIFIWNNANTSTEQMRLTSTGLGIGTSSPAFKADVINNSTYQLRVASTTANYANGGIYLGAAGTSDPFYYGALTWNQSDITLRIGAQCGNNSGGIAFYTSGSTDAQTEKMRLTFSGNLGIGTSSPGAKLNVVSSGTSVATFQGPANALVDVTDGTGTLRFQLLSNEPFITSIGAYPMRFGTNNTEQMRLDSSGNLGLGITPSAWGSGIKSLQVGNYSALTNNQAGFTWLSNNAFYDTSWKYLTTNRALYYAQDTGSGAHQWFIAPSGTAGNAITFTQAMTLDASGRLGVGVTTVEEKLHVAAANPTNGVLQFIQNTSTSAQTGALLKLDVGNVGTSALGIPGGAANALAFYVGGVTSGSERARITSGGDLLVGTTSAAFGEKFNVTAGNQNGALIKNTQASENAILTWNASTTGDAAFIAFATETSYTGRGTINYNRGAGLVAYNTTSDYRAKDILGPVQNPGTTIDALKVYSGKMKGATVERPMLVAHEAQAVTPYAVTGEKDAVNESGDPIFQQMDVSSLVPLLIAEIQSLRQRVAQLEGA